MYTDSYEEAKRKAFVAQESSDVSEVENKETRKKRAKVVESSLSPSPRKSKLKERTLTPPKVFSKLHFIAKVITNTPINI